MSSPPNVLADFQSYAYQHILIATDGAATVAALRDATDINQFTRNPSSNRYDVKRIATSSDTGGYVILIDTTTDSNLSIESVQWETIIAPAREGGTEKGQQYGNTIEIDGTMTIQEPYGLDFYRILADAAKSLGKAPSSIVYVLKTIFIGNKQDGTTEMISSVRPFNFVLTDIISSIDIQGTTYTLELVGMSNGVSKIPQHASAAQGLTVEISPNQTIGSVVQDFAETIHTKYNKHISALYGTIQESDPSQTTETLNSKFQKVHYSFTVDPIYDTDKYIAGTSETVTRRGENGSVVLTTGPKGTIESMLHKIMNSCQAVDLDGLGMNGEDDRYFIYKIVSTVLPSSDDTYDLNHAIRRYEMIQQQEDGELLQPSEGEYLELDYMYTGKNIDVLEFDMKFDFGLAFYMTVATSPNMPRSPEEWKSGVSSGDITGYPDTSFTNPTANTSTQAPLRAPLYLSTKESDPLIMNKIDSTVGSSYAEQFRRHAALEHIEASVKIAGNPNLLDELVNTTGEYNQKPVSGNTGAIDVARTPALVKMNVLFPTDDFNNQVREFWYKGFYNIYSITQNFEEGLFTQDLQMFSLPVSTKKGIHSRVGNTPAVSAPRDLLPELSSATATVCSTGGYNYDIITGFSTSEYVTEVGFVTRLEQIAAEIDTQPEWLLAVMSFETSGTFSPIISNPNSSAVGLIQFISSTAESLGTSTANLLQMTATQQLEIVRLYFLDQVNRGLKLNSIEALYTAVFTGTARTDPARVLYNKTNSDGSTNAAYAANSYLDITGDDAITVGEISSQIVARLVGGVKTFRKLLIASDDILDETRNNLTAELSNYRVTEQMLDAAGQIQILNNLEFTGYLNAELANFLTNASSDNACINLSQEHMRSEEFPISQRNHNPLNIRKTVGSATKWQGEIATSNPYANFSTPQHGLRAAYYLLDKKYYGDYKLYTVEQIINRWAPQSDNAAHSTTNYINAVSSALGVSPNSTLNINNSDTQLIAMAQAMAKWEGGALFVDYDASVYTDAVQMYRRG